MFIGDTNAFSVPGASRRDTNSGNGDQFTLRTNTSGLLLNGTNQFFLQSVTNGAGAVTVVPVQRPLSGTLIVSNPTPSAPSGTFAEPSRAAMLPGGLVRAPDGTLRAPNGTVLTEFGTFTAPSGAVRGPNGELIAPNGAVIAPANAGSANPGSGRQTGQGASPSAATNSVPGTGSPNSVSNQFRDRDDQGTNGLSFSDRDDRNRGDRDRDDRRFRDRDDRLRSRTNGVFVRTNDDGSVTISPGQQR